MKARPFASTTLMFVLMYALAGCTGVVGNPVGSDLSLDHSPGDTSQSGDHGADSELEDVAVDVWTQELPDASEVTVSDLAGWDGVDTSDGAVEVAIDGVIDTLDASVDSTSDVPLLDTGDGVSDVGPPDTADTQADTGVVASPGCSSGGGLTEGESTFELAGLQRRFAVRLPNNYGDSSKAWPVVLALHGNGGHLGTWDVDSGAYNLGGVLEDHAVLILVEAIDGLWRDYDNPDSYEARIELELDYFEHVISSVRNELCVDESALFSMGFSGGGSFSGVLGCRRTDIVAIASGGAVIYFDPAECVGAPAAWVAISEGDFGPGREAFRNHFRDGAGCSAESSDVSPSGCVAYDGCGDSTPVHYCAHPGGHVWPDFGNQALWDFFSQFLTSP